MEEEVREVDQGEVELEAMAITGDQLVLIRAGEVDPKVGGPEELELMVQEAGVLGVGP